MGTVEIMNEAPVGVIKRSISLPADLAEKLERLALDNHRSFSAQVAFFCAQMVAPSKTQGAE